MTTTTAQGATWTRQEFAAIINADPFDVLQIVLKHRDEFTFRHMWWSEGVVPPEQVFTPLGIGLLCRLMSAPEIVAQIIVRNPRQIAANAARLQLGMS